MEDMHVFAQMSVDLPIGNRNKAKVEGCGRFEASALPLTLSAFALRRKPR